MFSLSVIRFPVSLWFQWRIVFCASTEHDATTALVLFFLAIGYLYDQSMPLYFLFSIEVMKPPPL